VKLKPKDFEKVIQKVIPKVRYLEKLTVILTGKRSILLRG
jgi:hypothetical protein